MTMRGNGAKECIDSFPSPTQGEFLRKELLGGLGARCRIPTAAPSPARLGAGFWGVVLAAGACCWAWTSYAAGQANEAAQSGLL